MKGAPEAKQLDNVLRPLGFRRRGRTWNREGEEFVDVVDVQIASWDEYTVNAGVMWRAIEDVVWGLRGDGIVVEPSCTVRARIGMLAGDRRDRWWPLGDPTATAEVSDRLQSSRCPARMRLGQRTSALAAASGCYDAEMTRVRTTLTVDADVLRAVRVKAARSGKGDSEVIEEALRRDLGLDLLETLWARNQMDEEAAVELAVEAQHESRRPRG